jgi:heat shock protein HtpX
VLSAVGARLVSEVERPDLYKHVGELARLARLPLPRVYVSPNAQPNILTVGYGPRSAAVCCTEGLLRELTPAELRAVLAHELSHVIRRDVAVSSWSAGVASLVGLSPFNALVLQIAAPSGREYGADTDGALLTGDPMAMASALRKIDTGAAASPLPPRGSLAAAGHLMIAHPFPPAGVGRLLCTHPPTGERVRRLEALAGQGGVLPGSFSLAEAGAAALDHLKEDLRVVQGTRQHDAALDGGDHLDGGQASRSFASAVSAVSVASAASAASAGGVQGGGQRVDPPLEVAGDRFREQVALPAEREGPLQAYPPTGPEVGGDGLEHGGDGGGIAGRCVQQRLEDAAGEPGVDVSEHGGGHLLLTAGKEVVQAALPQAGGRAEPGGARPLEPVLPEGLRERRDGRAPLGHDPRQYQRPRSLRPGWPAGRGPERSQRNMRSASAIGTSLMLACRSSM